jgi:hypothetical protein
LDLREGDPIAIKPKAPETDENDFHAVDRLARRVTPVKLRPLTAEQRRRWKADAGAKAIPTLITVQPNLLKQADACAKNTGISRSQLLSDTVRRVVAASGDSRNG